MALLLRNKNITFKKNFLKNKKRYKMQPVIRKKIISDLWKVIKKSSDQELQYIFCDDIHWVERIFRITSYLLLLIFVYNLLSSQFIRYVNSPTVLSVEMDYLEWNVSYPALTICPVIKINVPKFQSVVDDLYNKTGMYLEAYVWAICTASVLNLNAVALIDPNNTNPINPNDFAKTAAELFNEFDKSGLYTNLNYSLSIQSAMTEMGMCHVINSNVAVFDEPLKYDDKDVRYVKSNLELSVFDMDFYAQIINDNAVAHVYIHSPNEPILSTFPSYTIDTDGYMTYGFQIWSTKISNELRSAAIKVRKCRHYGYLVPKLYNKLNERTKTNDLSQYKIKDIVFEWLQGLDYNSVEKLLESAKFINEPISTRYPVYSYNNCLLECRIKLVIKLCGCVPHFYKNTVGERICKLSELNCFYNNRKEIMALSVTNETLRRFSSNENLPRNPKDCSCLSSCETDIYRKDREFFTPESSSRLRIMFSAFPKIRIVKDIIFSFSDIFLRSGGAVNTCLGTSVISLMGLILHFSRLAMYFIMKIFISFKNNIKLRLLKNT